MIKYVTRNLDLKSDKYNEIYKSYLSYVRFNTINDIKKIGRG